MAVLDKAFQHAGVNPSQFQAGSPQSSHNPATGAPEYSLWSALLPVLGAIGGSFIPGIGTVAGMGLGGALGGAAGGLIDHTGAAGVGLGALGGGLGGAAGGFFGGGGSLGDLFSSGAGDAAGAAGSAASTAPFGAGAANTAATFNDLVPATTGQTGVGAVDSGAWAGAGGPNWTQLLKGGLGAGTGAGLLASLAPQTGGSPAFTPGLQNEPMHPINQSYNKLLGNNQTSRIQTGGFNPFTSVSGQPFNFFPQLPPGQ